MNYLPRRREEIVGTAEVQDKPMINRNAVEDMAWNTPIWGAPACK